MGKEFTFGSQDFGGHLEKAPVAPQARNLIPGFPG